MGRHQEIFDGLTKQRRYQIRRYKEHRCIICGKPAENCRMFCERHRQTTNERSKRRMAKKSKQ